MVRKTWTIPLDSRKYKISVSGTVVTVDDNRVAATIGKNGIKRRLEFQINSHNLILLEGDIRSLWLENQLFVDGINVETGEIYVYSESSYLILLLSAFFGFLFGLIGLIPYLIAIFICCIIHKNDEVNIEVLPKGPGAENAPLLV